MFLRCLNKLMPRCFYTPEHISGRQFQINHLFNRSFATLYRQAGRKKLKFKLVNYSVYYPATTVLQYCARKTSKNLALICTENIIFLQGSCKSCSFLSRLSCSKIHPPPPSLPIPSLSPTPPNALPPPPPLPMPCLLPHPSQCLVLTL